MVVGVAGAVRRPPPRRLPGRPGRAGRGGLGRRAFHRALSLPHGHGAARLSSGRRRAGGVRLVVEDEPDQAVADGCGRLLDLDADAATIDAALATDDAAPLVEATPGLRVAGSVDPFETMVRAVIGQQISVAGARTVAGRRRRRRGAAGRQQRAADPPLPRRRRWRASIRPCCRCRSAGGARSSSWRVEGSGRIDHDAGPDDVAASARGARDRPVDGRLRPHAGPRRPRRVPPHGPRGQGRLPRLGVDAHHAERWRPWRSYALHHVWTAAGFPAE